MAIAFVGPSFHQVTSSSKWFIELLQKHAPVTAFWDSDWSGGAKIAIKDVLDFDHVFVWQVEHVARAIAGIAPRKLMFIPMYDEVASRKASSWQCFTNTRILSFSWALHQRLRGLGLASFQTQYFPDPDDYSLASEFSALRGYLGQRRPEIGWPQISALSGERTWDKFLLHVDIDSTFEKLEPPSTAEIKRNNIEFSHLPLDSAQARERAAEANIYFAPRPAEGIGTPLLEAMARGQCVVAPDGPTMSEYLTHATTGLLYDPKKPAPLDLSKAAEIGAAARRHVEHGFEDWIFDRDNRLPEILFWDGTGRCPLPTRAQAEWCRPAINPLAQPIAPQSPKVTVAIVTLNAAETFEATLRSVCEQTFRDVEIVVVDGNSTDGTPGLIEKHRAHINIAASEPPEGPYAAMNHAARLGRGEFIIYMNSGDFFASRDALERAFRAAADGTDFIIGHHIHVTADGQELWHGAAHFEQTWDQLREGKLSRHWLPGVPCHQATLIRREMLLAEGGYDPKYKLAADHEFMFRMREKGKNFHHCAETIAIYAGGGISAQRNIECVQDWWRIARRYGRRRGVDRFFRAKFPAACEIGPWTVGVVAVRATRSAVFALRSASRFVRRRKRRRVKW